MRTVSKYVDGRAIWVDHGPGYGGSVKIGGQLVSGVARADTTTLRLAAAAKNREKKRREKAQA